MRPQARRRLPRGRRATTPRRGSSISTRRKVSAPVIGRSLLGDAEYENLRARLEPGQHALLIAANGLYSFKGSGFVRGGIFDRIQLVQGDGSVRFRDRQYKHLGEVAADMAQPFAEVGLFVVPTEAEFDPSAPWTLQLLVQRAIGALDKDFLLYELSYTLPARYLKPLPGSCAHCRRSRRWQSRRRPRNSGSESGRTASSTWRCSARP